MEPSQIQVSPGTRGTWPSGDAEPPRRSTWWRASSVTITAPVRAGGQPAGARSDQRVGADVPCDGADASPRSQAAPFHRHVSPEVVRTRSAPPPGSVAAAPADGGETGGACADQVAPSQVQVSRADSLPVEQDAPEEHQPAGTSAERGTVDGGRRGGGVQRGPRLPVPTPGDAAGDAGAGAPGHEEHPPRPGVGGHRRGAGRRRGRGRTPGPGVPVPTPGRHRSRRVRVAHHQQRGARGGVRRHQRRRGRRRRGGRVHRRPAAPVPPPGVAERAGHPGAAEEHHPAGGVGGHRRRSAHRRTAERLARPAVPVPAPGVAEEDAARGAAGEEEDPVVGGVGGHRRAGARRRHPRDDRVGGLRRRGASPPGQDHPETGADHPDEDGDAEGEGERGQARAPPRAGPGVGGDRRGPAVERRRRRDGGEEVGEPALVGVEGIGHRPRLRRGWTRRIARAQAARAASARIPRISPISA